MGDEADRTAPDGADRRGDVATDGGTGDPDADRDGDGPAADESAGDEPAAAGPAADEPTDESATDDASDPAASEAEAADGGTADAEAGVSGETDGGTASSPGVDVRETSMEPVDAATETGAGGPVEDREMPLTEHIEEMFTRLGVVLLVAGLVSVGVFPFGEEIINLLWDSALPVSGVRPHLYSPPELLVTQIKVASLGGVIVAMPMLVYQTYRFMRPGLYPHERRYYLAAVPTSLVLAVVGVTFAYFIVLPTIFTYFYEYSKDVTDIMFALGATFDLILVLMAYLAIIFQIPLFVMLAMMMGLVTREWLVARRLLFWGGFAGVAFLFSPDPTGMAPVILAVTMIGLFEGTLFLSKWTRHGRRRIRS